MMKKKEYIKPKIDEHGNIKDITKGGGNDFADGGEPGSLFG